MCTYIIETGEMVGSGKGAQGWFNITQANIYYDHPFHARMDHALTIDFVNPDQGNSARVAVELSAESALELIRLIQAALAAAASEHVIELPRKLVAGRA